MNFFFQKVLIPTDPKKYIDGKKLGVFTATSNQKSINRIYNIQ